MVPGRFAPYAASRGGDAVGEVVFERDGVEHRLVAWGEDDGSLWILFRDATSGVTTYAALTASWSSAPPAPDGSVTDRLQPGPQHAVRLHRLRAPARSPPPE